MIRGNPPGYGFPRTPSAASLVCVAALLLHAATALAQSSFESDPFASRFRERSNFDIKFRMPEKGGSFHVEVPKGAGGRQSLTGENVWEAEAPPGEVVTVTYQDLKLTARRIKADNEKKLVVAEGDVVFEQGKTRLTGARLDLDLNDKVGVVTDGALDLEGGLYVKGALLSKVGPRTFTITDGTLTACEGDKPTWEFRLKTGRITLEDYARLKHVTFRFGGLPLLYTPYLVWPALRDRASGFLVPGLGYNTRRGGFLGLSYYWAISRSADATFSADLYTKRFFGFGTELRAQPSVGTKAEGNFYWVRDRDLDEWRWQSLGKVTADDLAPGLRGVVSWIDFSDQQFFQDYNRNFDLVTTRSIKQEGFLTYVKDPYSLNLRLGREEALYGATSVVSERLPVLEGRLRPTALLGRGGPLFEAEGQAGLLRIDRPDQGGLPQPSGSYTRFDVFPKVSYPLSAIPWLSLQADAAYRLTAYGDSLSTDGRTLEEDGYLRRYFRGRLEGAGPSFARIFEKGFGPYTKLKHVIEPRFDYEYLLAPDDLQQRTPLFDEVDSVTPVHSIRYALVQRLLAKQKQGSAKELASLEISRTYYFQRPGERPGVPSVQGRQSTLDAALRVNAGSDLSLDARTQYDTHANQITSASLTAAYNSQVGQLALSLFDSRPVGSHSSAQVRFQAGAPVIKKLLRLDVQGNYDISKGKMLESRFLVTVEGSCFKVLTEIRDLRITGVPSRDFRMALILKNVGSFVDFTGSLAR